MDPWLPTEPRWHRTARVLFTVAFFAVWFEAVGCFLFFAHLARGGSPVPTPELTAPIVNHSHVFYVAASQKRLYDALLTTMGVGIPGIMVTGLVLHHLVGVKIFNRR